MVAGMRHGGRHDWYRNPATGVSEPVPRHREVKEPLERRIIRMLTEESNEQRSDVGGSEVAEPGDAEDSR